MISESCKMTILRCKVIYILVLIMMIFFCNAETVFAESESKENASIESKSEKTKDIFIVKKLSIDSDVIITSEGLESAPYKIMVSIADQKVYILKIEDEDIKLEKTMICSTGKDKTPTPTGTFKLPPDNNRNVGKWYYFSEFKVYAQYYRRIYKGYLFHSILFNKPNAKAIISSSVKNLGNKASHGCIRLSVEDAKWMYENIKGGTTVEIVSYSLKELSKM